MQIHAFTVMSPVITYFLHGFPLLISSDNIFIIMLGVMIYPCGWCIMCCFAFFFCYSFHVFFFTLVIDTKNSYVFQSWDATSISLSAACDLFMRFVTRTSHLEHEKFDAAKSRLIERGEKFGEISLKVIRQ
jgi:hypothetical protein